MTADPGSVAFTLTVVMESDWHVGTGGGRHGAIDRLIERDVDDLPFVPATTIRGIWRDAAERLALGLDEGAEAGGWARVVEAVFGDQPALADKGAITGCPPRHGGLSVGGARIPEILRNGLAGKDDPGRTRLRQALTFVKPGVAIDPASGRAKDDHLRFEEVARQGAILRASGRLALPADDKQANAMLAVLIASTRLVERLGGKRRRGTGRCTWDLAVDPAAPIASLDQAIEVLSQKEGAPEISGKANTTLGWSYGDTKATDGWKAVTLELTLLSPLVIADDVLGNVVTSLDFIPGTNLLPHVSRTLEASGCDVGPAIAAGDIRVSPAYPAMRGRRSLPMPLAWARVKDNRQGPDGKGQIINRLLLSETDSRQLKPIRGGWVEPDMPEEGGPPPEILTSVNKLVRTHNTVDDRVQRPTEDVGGVYSYEALKTGTKFRAVVRVRQSIAASLQGGWQAQLTAETLRLGRAAKAGYGEVRVEVVTEDAARTRGDAASQRFTVFFASDTLLRPPLLGPGTTKADIVEAIHGATGLSLQPVAPEKPDGSSADAPKTEPCDLRVRRIESWAAAWHLPRPSLIAVQAGSYITLEITGGAEAAPAALRALEHEGLGERRAEGYGEVLIDPRFLTQSTSGWERPKPGPKTAMPGQAARPPFNRAGLVADDRLRRYAEAVEDAAWLRAIEDAAFVFAADAARRKSQLGWEIIETPEGLIISRPPMSQLGALRSVLGAAEEPFDRALDWIGSVKRNDSRSSKWRDGLDRLRNLLEGKTDIWGLLLAAEGVGLPAELIRKPGDLKNRFRREAVRALLLASIRAHKRDLEQQGQQKPAAQPENEAA